MADNEEVNKNLEQVAEAAAKVAEAASAAQRPAHDSMGIFMDMVLQVSVEVGRSRMTIQDLLQLGQGSVVELEKLAGEPLDIYVNGRHVAKGEAVIVNEKFGVRLSEIISSEERASGLR